MKKYFRLINCAVLLLCVVFLILFVRYYSEARNEKILMANRNADHWSRVLLMSKKMEYAIEQDDDLEIFAMYHNAVLYDLSYYLEPYFTEQFLTVWYDSFLQDLVREYESSKYVKENAELYLKMNSDLQNICKDVLSIADKGEKEKLSLINRKSDTYKELKIDIDEFCEKYETEIKNTKW